MASKASGTRRRPSTAQSRKKPGARGRRAAADEPSGCNYVQKWSQLADTAGYVQVWIPQKHYDRVAKDFLKRTKGRYARMLLRRRLAPLAVEWKCTGTCYGGWCEEHYLGLGVYTCECGYFT